MRLRGSEVHPDGSCTLVLRSALTIVCHNLINMYAHDCQQFLEVSERLHLPFVAIRSHAYLYAMLDGEVFNREAGVGIVLYLIKGPLTQLSLLKLFSVIFRGIFLLVDLLKR